MRSPKWLILSKIIATMSHFKAKMYQSLNSAGVLSRAPTWIKGLLLRGGDGMGGSRVRIAGEVEPSQLLS